MQNLGFIFDSKHLIFIIIIKYNIMKKKSFTPENILISSASAAISSVILRTTFKNYNPYLKYGGGIILGAALIKKDNKNKLTQVGVGIMLANISNYIFDLIQKPKCPFQFKNHLPKPDTLLINNNYGNILQMNEVKDGDVFLTDKYDSTGWSSSFKLTHCLDISGNSGGLKSKKGDSVKWSKLKDYTEEFNSLLKRWIYFFEKQKVNFNDSPGGYSKKLLFWRSMVDDGKQLDIKNGRWAPKFRGEWSKYLNTLVRYDYYGNILYGAAGSAFGIDEPTLLAGANLNQLQKTGFDEEKDFFSIKRGINLYKSSFQKLKKTA